MSIEIHLVGRFEARGLLGRQRDASSWLGDIGRRAGRIAGDALEEAGVIDAPDGQTFLRLNLHPAAEYVDVVVPEPGLVVASAKTSTVGPGYHLYVCQLLQQLTRDFGIEWDPPDDDKGIGDETGFFYHGDASAVDQQMLAWLRAAAGAIATHLATGEFAGQFCLPARVRLEADGLATPLGPRSLGWAKRVSNDPSQGTDVFAWWRHGVNAEYHLGRASTRMWTEIRWRAPLIPEEEQQMDHVIEDLARAYQLDQTLEYPWAEWVELLRYRNRLDGRAAFVERHADETGRPPSIGYRRRPVWVNLNPDWSIKIPGSFFEQPSEDGWFAADANRSAYVGITDIRERDTGQRPPAQDLLNQVEPPSEGAITYEDRGVLGRARLISPTEAGAKGGALQGVRTAPGSVAVVRLTFEQHSDRDWAIETWRSMIHQPGDSQD